MERVIAVGHVDDHPAICDAIRAGFEHTSDIELRYQGATARDLRRLIDRPDLDVLVSDIVLAGEPVLFDALAGRGATIHPAVIVYSGYTYAAFFAAAVERGASGFVTKDQPIDDVIAAIRRVAAGREAFNASMLRAARGTDGWPNQETMELARLLASGASNSEIAANLRVSEEAIESRLRRLYLRYGVTGRAGLAALAVRQGWLNTDH